VTGKLPPRIENPVPEIEAELIVTATLPLEVTVTDFVTAVPTETLPKAREVALRLTAGVTAAGESAMLNVSAVPPACAVIVAVCAVVTPATVALNPALTAPDFTVTPFGTVTAGLLLVRET
jgi:hypothetical protein